MTQALILHQRKIKILLLLKKIFGLENFDEFIRLNDWLFQSIKNDDSQKILQMDIEGSEFEVLTYESAESLAQFSCNDYRISWNASSNRKVEMKD